jgi:[acyl-carrier-protein] S-malonyltransferase
MSPATVGIKAVMKTISVQDPRIPIISNVTGKPMTTAEEILELLPRQVCEPVLWEHSLRTLIAGDWKRMYEVGPGGQLKRICSRVDPSVEAHLIHIAP